MTEFATALNKQHRDEIAAMAGPALAERIDALEKRVAKLETLMLYAAPLGSLPAAPAGDPDPTA